MTGGKRIRVQVGVDRGEKREWAAVSSTKGKGPLRNPQKF